MLAIVYVAAFVVGQVALGIYTRSLALGAAAELIQPLHLFVTLYCAVNVMICLWEMALFFHLRSIQDTYAGYKKKVELGHLPSSFFLLRDISLGEALSFKYWHDVWATYSLFDESYSQEGSFGYNVDVGNGFSTILPTVAFLIASCDPEKYFGVSPRVFGLVSALFFYQAMYGTFVYFFQFIMNRRWKLHGYSTTMLALCVGATNGFWVIGPLAGIYASYKMVVDNNVNVFV